MKKAVILLSCIVVTVPFLVFSGGCKKSEPAQAQSPTEAAKSEETAVEQSSLPEGKIDLKILYAGKPGSGREKEFVSFLSQYFVQVKTGDLEAFDGSQANDVDVTIFDYEGDLLNAPFPAIDRDYKSPTLTIGVVGANICSGLARVTGYM